MKNVRVKYIKKGRSKYISHLDMNRCMTRALQCAKLPIWHTEGFNPHLFITFALPLSLGYTGEAEYMDTRLTEDISLDEMRDRMNEKLPEGIEVVNVYEPVYSPNEIETALFEIVFYDEDNDLNLVKSKIEQILSQDEIIVQKKSKSGMKDINLKQYITDYSLFLGCDRLVFKIYLPAGNTVNINPSLLLGKVEESVGCELYSDITRKEIYIENGKVFR